MSDILETLNKLFDISGCAVTGKAADEIRTLRAKLAEKEKPKRSGWARIDNGSNIIHVSREKADGWSEKERLTCVEIPGKPRPFDLEAAKRGEKLITPGSEEAEFVGYIEGYVNPVVYFKRHSCCLAANTPENMRMSPGPSRWLNVYKVWDTEAEARAEGHDVIYVEW